MLRVCGLFLFLTTYVGVSLAGSICYNPTDAFIYCELGCCGSDGNQTCCSFAVWIIALSVIGGVSLIAVVIFVVGICICQKRARARAERGRVIQTYEAQQPVIHYSANTCGMSVQGEINQGFVTTTLPDYSTRKTKY